MNNKRIKVEPSYIHANFKVIAIGISVVIYLVIAIAIAYANINDDNKTANFIEPTTGSLETESTISQYPDSKNDSTGQLKLNGNLLYYSALNFTRYRSIRYPEVSDTNPMDILPFLAANILENETDLVIKATISDICFHDYNYILNDPGLSADASKNNLNISTTTIVYRVRIDEILYSKQGYSYQAGESFMIEDPLWTESYCLSDSVFRLNINRQYILLIKYNLQGEGILESPFCLSHNFIPQIECTEDGGYVFYAINLKRAFEYKGNQYSQAGWAELINDDTISVIMDHYEAEGHIGELSGNMYMRTDTGFIDDIQELIIRWCK